MAFFIFRQRVYSETENLILLQYENITNTIQAVEHTELEEDFQDQTRQSIDEAANLGLLTFIYNSQGTSIEAPTYLEDYIPKGMNGLFTRTVN